jgi:hypothetical protein
MAEMSGEREPVQNVRIPSEPHRHTGETIQLPPIVEGPANGPKRGATVTLKDDKAVGGERRKWQVVDILDMGGDTDDRWRFDLRSLDPNPQNLRVYLHEMDEGEQPTEQTN